MYIKKGIPGLPNGWEFSVFCDHFNNGKQNNGINNGEKNLPEVPKNQFLEAQLAFALKGMSSPSQKQ